MAEYLARFQLRVSPTNIPFVFNYRVDNYRKWEESSYTTNQTLSSGDFLLSEDGTYLYYNFEFDPTSQYRNSLGVLKTYNNNIYAKIIVYDKEIQQSLYSDDVLKREHVRYEGYRSTDDSQFYIHNVNLPSALVSNYNPSKPGEGLFSVVQPIIRKQYTATTPFITELAQTISDYIVYNDMLTGAYVGTIPGTPPVVSTLVVGTGNFKAVGSPIMKEPKPYKYQYAKWIKDSLNETVRWQLIINPPHSGTATVINPVVTMIDTIGDISNLRTAEGIWALICDAICWAVMSAPERLLPVSATGTDGSSGTLTWVPEEIDMKQSFVIKVNYDASNYKLINWLSDYVDISSISGEVIIPISNTSFSAANTVWKGLTSIATNCSFYKKQSSGEEILLCAV